MFVLKTSRKNTLITILIALFFLLSIIGLFYNQYKTYKSINGKYKEIAGITYSKIDFQYFYQNYVQNFIQEDYAILDYLKLQPDVDFSKQTHSDQGDTWENFFIKQANNDLVENAALCAAEAENTSFHVSDKELDAYVENVKSQLSEKATAASCSLDQYVSQVYLDGAGFNDLKSAIILQGKAMKYKNYLYNQVDLGKTNICNYYYNNKKNYDLVSYRCIIISTTDYMNEVSKEFAENGHDASNTLEEDILSEAKERAGSDAKKIYDETTSASDLEQFAHDYASENVKKQIGTNADYSLYSNVLYKDANSVYRDWLFDNKREYGNMCIIHDDKSENYYILYFLNRQKDTAVTATYNQIFLGYSPSNSAAGVTEEDRDAVKNKAKSIYDDIKGQKTLSQSIFESYAERYNQDYNTKNTNGLKENIASSNVSEGVSKWLFPKGNTRKNGDVGLIYEQTGVYIIFFSSYSEDAWYTNAKEDYQTEQYEAMLNNLKNKYGLKEKL